MSAATDAGVGRKIAPGEREGASTASEGLGAHRDAPAAPDAPEGRCRPDVTDGGKQGTPLCILQRAEQAALAIEAVGGMLAASVGRMKKATARGCDKAERDEAWIREWREITLTLDDHANAMLSFLGGFMSAPCFRRIAEAAHLRDIEERKAALIAEMQAEEKRKRPEPGEGEMNH